MTTRNASPFAIEPVRFSELKLLAQSPAHYRHAVERGRTNRGEEDRDIWRLGRAVHSLVLGGPRVVCYESIRRGKAWDAFQSETLAADPDAEILSAREHRLATAMSNAVLAHPEAARLLAESTHREHEIAWERNGLRCAGRVDLLRAGPRGWLCDLKIARTAEPERFARNALALHYHAQLSWYRDGMARVGVLAPDADAYLVCVESSAPYPVVVRRLGPRALDYGNRRCIEWLERLKGCASIGMWSGYSDGVLELEVPDEADEDFELTFGSDESTGDVRDEAA